MIQIDETIEITPEIRQLLIAEEAYRISEQRGFKGECPLHDWLEAEAKVDHIYGKPTTTH